MIEVYLDLKYMLWACKISKYLDNTIKSTKKQLGNCIRGLVRNALGN